MSVILLEYTYKRNMTLIPFSEYYRSNIINGMSVILLDGTYYRDDTHSVFCVYIVIEVQLLTEWVSSA